RNTRRPISVPSARSACSSAPPRTSTESDRSATAIASAPSAPAPRAASSRDWASWARSVMAGLCFGSQAELTIPPRHGKYLAQVPGSGPEAGATTAVDPFLCNGAQRLGVGSAGCALARRGGGHPHSRRRYHKGPSHEEDRLSVLRPLVARPWLARAQCLGHAAAVA